MQQNIPPHPEGPRIARASRRTHHVHAKHILSFIFLFAFIAIAHAADPKFPPLTGRVVDQANILSASTRQHLTALLEEHERKTSNQVVVVTLATLDGYEIADYAVRLGRAWAIGQRGRNNGVIFLVAPRERDVRIEVGYGLEGALTDARASAIIQQEVIPRFRAGDIEGGVVQGTLAILGSIEGTYQPKPMPQAAPAADFVPLLIIGFFVLFVVINTFNAYRQPRRRGPWGTPVIFPGGSGGGGGGGWSSGGSSGGGFSGGGGSFGGGGASGRW